MLINFRTINNSQNFIVFLITLTFLIQLINAAFDFSECDKKKHCIGGKCQNTTDLSTCEYVFSYIHEKNAPFTDMELYTRRSSPKMKYVAVGFSNDQQMGEDSVTHCAAAEFGNGKPEVHLSINPPGKSNVAAGPEAEKGNLEFVSSELTGDHIYCKFRQRSANANQKTNLGQPNLNKPYYIMLARGPVASPVVLSIHSLDGTSPDFPFISDQMYNVFEELRQNEPETQGPKQNREAAKNETASTGSQVKARKAQELNLIDYHGILMLISWFGMIMIGIYSARYMRSAWANTMFMGLKIWFHIHRTLNFLAVLLMVFSTVLVFWKKEARWEGPWFGRTEAENTSAGAWHSLAGIIAVVLALQQPFGALLRCGIDHPKRPIFNLIHRSAGLIAFICATIATILAINFFAGHFAFPAASLWIFIVFLVIFSILIIVSEVLRIGEVKQQQKINAIEMQTRNKGVPPTPSDTYYYQTQRHTYTKQEMYRKTLFAVVSVLCVVTTVVLVLFIVLQFEFKH